MRDSAILAIDQGTTSVRASVVSAGLDVEATGVRSAERTFPEPGWVELDAEVVVKQTRLAVRDAVRASGRTASEIAAVGLANQGETVVVWERQSGRPIAPAIVWQCRRTERRCAALRTRSEDADRIRALTGLPIDPYFSATKLAWLLDSVPGARGRAHRGELCAGTLDAYTVFVLTEGRRFVTDPSTSSRTLLSTLSDGQFADELCDFFDVPRSILPEVVSSDANVGSISIADGFAPIRAMMCDQPAALLGTGCLSPGDVKCTYGTGAFVQVNTGSHPAVTKIDDGLLRSIAWDRGGERTYLLEGSVLAAGDVLTWLRDGLGVLKSSEDVEPILAEVADSDGVVFLPALTGLGAPTWAGDTRGAMLGLHRGVRDAHVVRAALEGIAHLVADVLDTAALGLPIDLSALRVDGGLSRSRAFVGLQADIAGRPLLLSDNSEATSRGIAIMAGVGAGLFELETAVRKRNVEIVSPSMSEAVRQVQRARHRKLVELSTSPEMLALIHR